MINLLPPPIKNQIRYAQLNGRVIRYVWLIILIGFLIAAGFLGAQWYLSRRLGQAERVLKEKEATVERFKPFEDKVKQVNDRLNAIKQVQAAQPKFSVLLNELATITPKGATIGSINLTGDDKKPVVVSATATSYNAAVALRDALANSPRVSAADIESVSALGGGFSVQISVAFKPGQAK